MVVGIDVLAVMVEAAKDTGAAEYTLKNGHSLVMELNGDVQILKYISMADDACIPISALEAIDRIEVES